MDEHGGRLRGEVAVYPRSPHAGRLGTDYVRDGVIADHESVRRADPHALCGRLEDGRVRLPVRNLLRDDDVREVSRQRTPVQTAALARCHAVGHKSASDSRMNPVQMIQRLNGIYEGLQARLETLIIVAGQLAGIVLADVEASLRERGLEPLGVDVVAEATGHDGLPKGWPDAVQGGPQRVEGAIGCEEYRSQNLLGHCMIGSIRVQKSFVQIEKDRVDQGWSLLDSFRQRVHG